MATDTYRKHGVLVKTFTAGEDLTVGDLVELGNNAGEVVKATADSNKVIGVVVDARYEGMYGGDITTQNYVFVQGTKVAVLVQGVAVCKVDAGATVSGPGVQLKAGAGVLTNYTQGTDAPETLVAISLEAKDADNLCKVLLKI